MAARLGEPPAGFPDNREALRRLLELNLAVGRAGSVRLRDKEWQYIETLAIKVVQHASTAYFLAENPTRLRENQRGFIDWPSLQVLSRACLEAYLTLHYVYISAPNGDAREFRYCSWMIAGFAPRQSVPVFDARGRRQLEVDREFLAQMRRRLERSGSYQALSNKQRRAVLAGRDWPIDSTLTNLAAAALGPQIGAAVYRYLSGFAHSSALSAVQMAQIKDAQEQRRMADGALWLITLTLARTTQAYARRFVYARKALGRHPDKWLNDIWCELPTPFDQAAAEKPA